MNAFLLWSIMKWKHKILVINHKNTYLSRCEIKMNLIQRILKNTGLLLISNIITYGLAFIFMMYSARYLGVENFGIISFALAFSGITVIFADLGLSSLTARDVARDKTLSEKYIKNIGPIKLFLSLFTLISTIAVVFIMGYTIEVIGIVTLITLYSLFGSFSYMFYALFQAHERMEYQAVGLVLNSLLLLGGAIFLIYNKMDVISFALLYFFTGLIVFLYTVIICGWKFILPKMEVDLSFWKTLLKTSLPISLLIILYTITFRVDTVLLSILDGNTSVGIYSAAYRLIEVLIFIPTVFTASIYPVFSRFHVSSEKSLKTGYTTSFKYLAFLGLPIAVGVTLLSDKIIFLIYGAQFTESILALQILIWAIPVIFISYVSGTIMISINKQNAAIKIIIICMIVNIVLNLIFIPSFSFVAASVSTVITELIEMVLFTYFLFKFICKVNIKDTIMKPIIASLIMGLFIFYTDLNFYVQIITAACIYFLTLFALHTFSDEDFNLIRQAIDMKKK